MCFGGLDDPPWYQHGRCLASLAFGRAVLMRVYATVHTSYTSLKTKKS